MREGKRGYGREGKGGGNGGKGEGENERETGKMRGRE